ncbi:MAG: NYN domain-containing protein [Gemmatimonadales bacterium]|nr:NYN domain-containing protein [Gemmatimonadales bacterium]
MGQDRETKIALLIDFDNVALGARDAGQRFDIKLLLQRILEKGKVLVKKAYADWHFYKEHMSPLHESAVELIEIPMPRISGKNSADIKLVVDAMDLCYSKDHIDTFVIVSGDSDFSPLVSKLRENNKWVIGVGVKNSSSRLLIGNCDEFIFYDDIFRHNARQSSRTVKHVPSEKRELFDFLLKTTQSLLQESRGVLYSSLIKDTMTRKQPDFNERAHGYSNFGDLLEDARNMGLLNVERDAQAGGTWVVHGMVNGAATEATAEATSSGTSRSSRRRRRSSGRGRGSGGEAAAKESVSKEEPSKEERSKEVTAKPIEPVQGSKKLSSSDQVGKPTPDGGRVSGATDRGPRSASQAERSPESSEVKKKTKKVGKKTAGKSAEKVNKKVTKKTSKKVVKKAVAKKTTKKTTTKTDGKPIKKGSAGKKVGKKAKKPATKSVKEE